MTGATRRGGRNGIAERRARPKAAQNTLNLARAAAHDLATFRTILDLQSESVSSLLDGQRMPPDVAEKLQRILRAARAASGTAAHFIQLARDAEATLRLALSGQLEPRRVLLLSCNARGETRAGCLLRLWDASWVTAAGGASATHLVKSAAAEGALVVAGRAAIPEKAVAWLREAALSCPVAIVAAKPRPRGLLGRLGANVKFIPSGSGAFAEALAFLAGAASPGRRRGAPAKGSPKARRPAGRPVPGATPRSAGARGGGR